MLTHSVRLHTTTPYPYSWVAYRGSIATCNEVAAGWLGAIGRGNAFSVESVSITFGVADPQRAPRATGPNIITK